MNKSKEETLPRSRDEIRQVQLERLQALLWRGFRNVTFYHDCFKRIGLDPSKITDFEQLTKLPLTDRKTLVQAYPYDMFAVPLREIIRLHSTPGGAGHRVAIGYTRNDVEHWTQMSARDLQRAGVTEEDVVQIGLDYSLSSAGLGFHYGAERIGASVFPCWNISPEEELELAQHYRTTVIITSPAHAREMREYCQTHSFNPKALSVRLIICVGDEWSDDLRWQLEKSLFVTVLRCYGLAEVISPGIAGECAAKDGLHLNEDHFLVEIVNPETGQVLPPGHEGEMVITTLSLEGFPLLRYRTGDRATLLTQPCTCGEPFVRLVGIVPAEDGVVLVHGVRVYPSQVSQALAEIELGQLRFQMTPVKDELEVLLEARAEVFSDEMKQLEQLRNRIAEHLQERLRVRTVVRLVDVRSL